MTSPLRDATTRALAHLVGEGRVLGGQLAVIHHGDTVVDQAAGIGGPEGRTLSPTDRVPWLCATKALTGIAAQRLLAARSIPLDTPVHDFLPTYVGEGRQGIRLRQLLDHTAGIRSTRRPCDPLWSSPECMLEASLDARPEPGWEPGRDGGYHFWPSAYVLREVVERVSGCLHEAVVHEWALQPAGITDDVIYGRGRADAWRAPGTVMPQVCLWDGRRREAVRLRDGALSGCPASGALGPVSALARLLDQLRKHCRAGDPVARRATTPSWAGADRTFGVVMEYGLGLQVNMRRLGCGRALPTETFGHAGGDSVVGLCVPGLDLTIGAFLTGAPGPHGSFRSASAVAPIVDAAVEAVQGRGK